MRLVLYSQNTLVSIHAPTGGATFPRSLPVQKLSFQFTRPRGARPRDTHCVLVYKCFNSRAHGGRDVERAAGGPRRAVSIHAPTGGATTRRCSPRVRSAFQFTRPRGARRSRPCRPSLHPRFNSRAHGGRDPRLRDDRVDGRGFNSRAHGGRDEFRHGDGSRKAFQFTRPRGARQKQKG